jgi:hypothetical protein
VLHCIQRLDDWLALIPFSFGTSLILLMMMIVAALVVWSCGCHDDEDGGTVVMTLYCGCFVAGFVVGCKSTF